MNQTKPYHWLYFILGAQGLAALLWLLSIPSEGSRISLTRLALAGVLVGISGLWFVWGYRRSRIVQRFSQPSIALVALFSGALLASALFVLRYLDPERLLPIYERLSPLLVYLLLVSLQLALLPSLLERGFHLSALRSFQSTYRISLLAFTVLLAVFVFIAVTRLGLTRDPAYWGEPGVPLQGWQFVLALLLGAGVFCLSYYWRPSLLGVALPVSLYLFAVVLWLSVPVDVLKSSFYMRISAPDFQPYPYSDSSYYDRMAQSLLIGHPYQGVIPTRPLYIAFLALLHLLSGENYPRILAVQTIVLAILPVVLYAVGARIHSRTAGVTMALFFIFRELTSQWISSETRVTNTKMILVDLPTLLLLLVTLLFALRWLRDKTPPSAFVAGCSFGLLLLLRTQSMLVMPIILLFALIEMGWRNRSYYLQAGLYLAGLALTIAPWLTHNYLLTGKFAFDADFQVNLIATQYAAYSNLDVSRFNFEGMGLLSVLLLFLINDPWHVLGFISNHFLAALTHALLVLPLMQPFAGLRAPINLYWMEWNGSLAWYNVVLLVLYLAVIALGLAAAWKRWRWRGFLPLAVSLGYAFATALSRFSSWRYDFPADWVAYFYFAVGFAEVLTHVAALFGVAHPAYEPSPAPVRQPRRGWLFALAAGFVLVGALPWMLEGLAPPRYADQTPANLLAQISSIPQAPSTTALSDFVAQPGTYVQVGRLLYPRYYSKDTGLASANPYPAYLAREYPRLGFLFLNQISHDVVFPSDSTPVPMPHAADVIVLGCQRSDYVEARLIAIPGMNEIHLTPDFATSCADQ